MLEQFKHILKKEKSSWAWALYDWGNSAFATTVMAGFFPLFFKNYWSAGVSTNTSTAFLGFANSLASLIIALFAPALGSIADQYQGRKKFFTFFAFLGAITTSCLFLVNRGGWLIAAFIYIIGIIGFLGGNIFYDSLLLDVSSEKNVDQISSRGFALGYLGGGLLFLINVLWFLKPALFGLPAEKKGAVFNINRAQQEIKLEKSANFSIPEDAEIGEAILKSNYSTTFSILSLDTIQLSQATIKVKLPSDFPKSSTGEQVRFGKYKRAKINTFADKQILKLTDLTRRINNQDSLTFTITDTISYAGFNQNKLLGVKGLSKHYENASIESNFYPPEQEYLSIRISFLSVGIWWAIFTLPLLIFVKEEKHTSQIADSPIIAGFKQLYRTLKKIRHMKVILLYLFAYWLYIDGVHTIVRMAVDYGLSIGLKSNSLIVALLLTQFVGFPSALFIGKLSQKWGVKNLIYICIFIYFSVTIYAMNMNTEFEFYILAVVVGLAQGGIQALSRSYYSRLIPHNQSAEFYGFYNMLGKFAAILGPALIGFVNIAAVNMGYNTNFASRIGIGSIAVFFIIGGILLYFVDEEEGKREKQHLQL